MVEPVTGTVVEPVDEQSNGAGEALPIWHTLCPPSVTHPVVTLFTDYLFFPVLVNYPLSLNSTDSTVYPNSAD